MGLRDQLAGTLPADLLPYVSDHFEVIGDIAIVRISPKLRQYRTGLARAIVSRRKNIRTVLEKTGKIGGDSRTAHFTPLLGESTVTLHREYGFSYRLDVTGAFFSSRMVSERKRVACLVQPGEKVYVPFAGIGPFAIPAAARGAEVWAVEQNPEAFRWLSANVDLNHVRADCHIMEGDARDTSRLPDRQFDRIVIPAPYGMDRAAECLLPLLGAGGMAHIYTFRKREEVPALLAAYRAQGCDMIHCAPCGNVARGVSRWVFDLVRHEFQ